MMPIDLRRSLIAPGTPQGSFRVAYSFPNEHLVELANRTVHGALLMVLVEGEDCYTLYLAVAMRALQAGT
jgi:hypothetical protein